FVALFVAPDRRPTRIDLYQQAWFRELKLLANEATASNRAMMMVVRGRFLSASSPMKTGIATPRSAAPIRSRVGRAFDRLLDRIEANGVRIILVEDAGRFARDLVVQELGIALQDKRGVWLLTASGDDLTDSDDLGRKMMCQVSRRLHGVRKGSPGRRIA